MLTYIFILERSIGFYWIARILVSSDSQFYKCHISGKLWVVLQKQNSMNSLINI